MTIKNWPEGERPREKLLEKGASALSDAELLAILLRTGTQGMSAVHLARELLRSFGSLRALFAATLPELQQHKGMGLASFAQFATVRELGKRILAEEVLHLPTLNQPQAVREYLRLCIGFESVEVMVAIFLNRQNQVIKYEEISRGTVAENTVYVRELAKCALDCFASGVIVAHNHPSGTMAASSEDGIFTQRLQAALNLLDMELIDHVIVTAQNTWSFREQGLL